MLVWLITDCYSRLLEMTRLGTLIAAAVVAHCTSVFSRHGIPEIVVTDNGPQFSKVPSSVFASFACDNFEHVTSSPKYPQGNSLAEAAVKILKQSLKKTGDLYLTLLAYRSSLLKNGYSPAELLRSRKLCTSLPVAVETLLPRLPN